jgi:hypothetical protein
MLASVRLPATADALVFYCANAASIVDLTPSRLILHGRGARRGAKGQGFAPEKAKYEGAIRILRPAERSDAAEDRDAAESGC